MPEILSLDPLAPAPEPLRRARAVLDAGGLVVVPTDTVYGIAADARSAAAVARVFAAKGRVETQPLPLVVRDPAQALACWTAAPPAFAPLAAAFWPGPLTLLGPAAAGFPPSLSAGSGAIAVRQPASAILAALLALTGYPLTATSANLSGAPAALTAAAAAAALGDRVALVLDGGAAVSSLPSTLLDLRSRPPRILRAGAIAAERLAPFLCYD